MLAQFPDPQVVTPEAVWPGLTPLIVLAGGAVALIMFRSVVTRLPAHVEAMAVAATGPVTVVVAWVTASLVGDDVPLAAARDDMGDPLYFILFAIVAAAGAALVHTLRIGFDAAFTVGTGLVTLAAVAALWNDHLRVTGPFNALGDQLNIDGFTLVFTGVIAAAVVLVALLLDDYLRRERIGGPEMYVLMLLSASGGVVMAAAGDLIVLFLGLETLSIAVYVMAALHIRRNESLEAGLKYFVLGAFSSAFLLYGIALVYGATGSTNLLAINRYLASVILLEDAMLLAGFAMLLVGLGFKVAAVPFHAWTPDVYQGAPTPVVAFMASAVKAAGFAALVRVFVLTFDNWSDEWQPVVYGLAVATLAVGSVMAVVQRDAKRMLAYSSISHAGFILVGVQAASTRGTAAVVFYVAVYSFMVIGSFGVLSMVSGPGDRATSLDALDGLAVRRPALSLALTFFLLAQAGVPLTTGFVAKFEVIGAAIDARSFWLAVVAMVSAVVSAFLYLRIVLSLYLGGAGAEEGDDESVAVTRAAGAPHPAAVFAVGVALAVTIGFGIVPEPIDELARDAVPFLVSAG